MKKIMIKFKYLGVLAILGAPFVFSCTSAEDAALDVGYNFGINSELFISPVVYGDDGTRAANPYPTTDPDSLWLTNNNLKEFSLFLTNPVHSAYDVTNRSMLKQGAIWYSYIGTTSTALLCHSDSVKFASCGYAPRMATGNDKTALVYSVNADQTLNKSIRESDFLIYPEDTIDPDYRGYWSGGAGNSGSGPATTTYATTNPLRPSFNVRVLAKTKKYDITFIHGFSKLNIKMKLDGTWDVSSGGPGRMTNPLSNVRVYYPYLTSTYNLTWNGTDDYSSVVSGSQGPILPYESPDFVWRSDGAASDAVATYVCIFPAQTINALGIAFEGNGRQYYCECPAWTFDPNKSYTVEVTCTTNPPVVPGPSGPVYEVSGDIMFTVTPWVSQTIQGNTYPGYNSYGGADGYHGTD